MSNSSKKKSYLGVTLVELLVVITILILLVGVVLPLAQPVLRGRGVREASRQISAFLAAAQARSMSDGRSYGVMLVRDPNDATGNQAYQLVMVKAPPLYAGDSVNSYSTRSPEGPWAHTLHGASRGAYTLGQGFLFPGDLIRFGFRGPFYRIWDFGPVPSPPTGTTPPPPPDVTIFFVPASQSTNIPPPPATRAVAPPAGGVYFPFQIERRPRVTAAAPLVLPQGTFVDLQFSGVGSDLPGSPTSGVLYVPGAGLAAAPIIMFNSDGSVGRFYGDIDVTDNGMPDRGPTNPHLANETIHLLVSRPMKSGLDSLSQDAESLWVSISQKTGRVSTYQNLGAAAGGSVLARALQARAASTKSAQVVGGR